MMLTFHNPTSCPLETLNKTNAINKETQYGEPKYDETLGHQSRLTTPEPLPHGLGRHIPNLNIPQEVFYAPLLRDQLTFSFASSVNHPQIHPDLQPLFDKIA